LLGAAIGETPYNSPDPALGLPAGGLIMPSREMKKERFLNDFEESLHALGIITS